MGCSEGTSPEIEDFWCADESPRDSSTPVETVGDGPVAYLGQSNEKRVTAGGESCFIAPAVTPTETKNNSSKDSVSRPATHSTSHFTRVTAVCCRKNWNGSSHLLYRFSCEVETKFFESEIDNQTYLMVAGEFVFTPADEVSEAGTHPVAL